jgi:hypothetical protein
MKYRVVSLSLVGSLILLGALIWISTNICSCDSSPLQPDPSYRDYFPKEVGSTWRYAAVDSNHLWYDTTILTISKVVADTLGQVYTESRDSFFFFAAAEVTYLREVQDSIRVYFAEVPGYPPPRPYLLWVLPFDSGHWWNNDKMPDNVDTLRVIGFEDVTVPAGHFSGAVVIDRYYWGLNRYLQARYWFVSGIGIVKKRVNSYSGPARFGDWTYELLEYHFPRQRPWDKPFRN